MGGDQFAYDGRVVGKGHQADHFDFMPTFSESAAQVADHPFSPGWLETGDHLDDPHWPDSFSLAANKLVLVFLRGSWIGL
jgi:hypothetical protein